MQGEPTRRTGSRASRRTTTGRQERACSLSRRTTPTPTVPPAGTRSTPSIRTRETTSRIEADSTSSSTERRGRAPGIASADSVRAALLRGRRRGLLERLDVALERRVPARALVEVALDL